MYGKKETIMNKYEQMSDFEINKAVEKATGMYCEDYNGNYIPTLDTCNNPSDAFPIILKYEIAISPYSISEDSPNCEKYKDMWFAMKDKDWYIDDKNPLRAAMIIFLMIKETEK